MDGCQRNEKENPFIKNVQCQEIQPDKQKWEMDEKWECLVPAAEPEEVAFEEVPEALYTRIKVSIGHILHRKNTYPYEAHQRKAKGRV